MVEAINLDDTKKWDTIVRSFKDYDVYYLPGYVKAYQLNGDGEPLLLYFEGEGNRAINVVMKRDIGKYEKFSRFVAENTYFDFTTPYGFGGFLNRRGRHRTAKMIIYRLREKNTAIWRQLIYYYMKRLYGRVRMDIKRCI